MRDRKSGHAESRDFAKLGMQLRRRLPDVSSVRPHDV
jgi:hypothetical protein